MCVAGGIFLLVCRGDLEFGSQTLAEDPPTCNDISHHVTVSLLLRVKVPGPLLEIRKALRQQRGAHHRLIALR